MICAILMLTLFFLSLQAKDLGKQGYTFPIQEENLKRVIMERAGELSTKALQKEAVERSIFKRVTHIEEAQLYHSFFYDPSYMVEEDITDHRGALLFPKGKKINPLEGMILQSGLLFFDGDNHAHINWAKEQIGEFKWILTSGHPIKLQQESGHPVFFDQGAIYTKKFGVKKIPCRITQSDQQLLIEEIPIKGSIQ